MSFTKKSIAPFSVMVKPYGPICNLACDYCYYLPKTHLYTHSNFRMSFNILEDFTRQMISGYPSNQINFAWQGGEPTLMGLPFYKEAVRLQREIAPESMRVSNVLQTNGTRINSDWCKLFRDNDFLIGLSLDGPSNLHNAYRHDSLGNGSFTQVMNAIHLFKRFGVKFNILCCVHKENMSFPLDVYRFLRDEVGANFIQFIPIVQREVDQSRQEIQAITERSVDGESYGKFLIAVFDEWINHDIGQVFIQIFDVALGIYLHQPSSLCVFAETCGKAMVLEHNGDLYSCDHFVTPDHLLGNIVETPLIELVELKRQMQFGNEKRDNLSKSCRECDVRFLCNGGCPKNRNKGGLNFLCEGYKHFFRHIDRPMRNMANIIRKEQGL